MVASLDPNIILQARAPQIMNPLEVRERAVGIQGAEQQNALRALQMRYAQEDRDSAMTQENALRAYYGAGGGENALRALSQASPKAFSAEQGRLLKEQETKADIGKKKADAAKVDIDNLYKQLETFTQFSRGVQDQASYDQALQLASQFMPPETFAKLPRQYSPEINAKMQQFGITSLQQLQDATTRRSQDMTDARTRSEGAANRAVQMRGQTLTDTRERERIQVQKDGAKKEDAKEAARARQATAALGLVDEAEKIINDATGSYTGAAFDQVARAMGVSTKGAQGIARLKVLEAGLMMNMPRMEGPQSNADVQLYREASAQIGDPTVPNETKKAALQTVRTLNQKYTGQAPQAGGFRILGVE